MKKFTFFIAVIDVLVGICFFIFYGPFSYVRNLIISTAMITKTHQYIAYTFYSDDTIQDVLSQNSYIPLDEDVDLSKIVIDTSEQDHYTLICIVN